ncbi:MAG: hypothetical protein K2X49_07255 [Acetobacteraceae bacterium]|nr:hypothetical protein [Acetobacteraceae bacterium]
MQPGLVVAIGSVVAGACLGDEDPVRRQGDAAAGQEAQEGRVGREVRRHDGRGLGDTTDRKGGGGRQGQLSDHERLPDIQATFSMAGRIPE